MGGKGDRRVDCSRQALVGASEHPAQRAAQLVGDSEHEPILVVEQRLEHLGAAARDQKGGHEQETEKEEVHRRHPDDEVPPAVVRGGDGPDRDHRGSAPMLDGNGTDDDGLPSDGVTMVDWMAGAGRLEHGRGDRSPAGISRSIERRPTRRDPDLFGDPAALLAGEVAGRSGDGTVQPLVDLRACQGVPHEDGADGTDAQEEHDPDRQDPECIAPKARPHPRPSRHGPTDLGCPPARRGATARLLTYYVATKLTPAWGRDR